MLSVDFRRDAMDTRSGRLAGFEGWPILRHISLSCSLKKTNSNAYFTSVCDWNLVSNQK